MTLRFNLDEAAAAAFAGYRKAAQMVLVGTVLLCGGNKRQAKKVAEMDDAVLMIDGQINHLRNFARTQLSIIKCKIIKQKE